MPRHHINAFLLQIHHLVILIFVWGHRQKTYVWTLRALWCCFSKLWSVCGGCWWLGGWVGGGGWQLSWEKGGCGLSFAKGHQSLKHPCYKLAVIFEITVGTSKFATSGSDKFSFKEIVLSIIVTIKEKRGRGEGSWKGHQSQRYLVHRSASPSLFTLLQLFKRSLPDCRRSTIISSAT